MRPTRRIARNAPPVGTGTKTGRRRSPCLTPAPNALLGGCRVQGPCSTSAPRAMLERRPKARTCEGLPARTFLPRRTAWWRASPASIAWPTAKEHPLQRVPVQFGGWARPAAVRLLGRLLRRVRRLNVRVRRMPVGRRLPQAGDHPGDTVAAKGLLEADRRQPRHSPLHRVLRVRGWRGQRHRLPRRPPRSTLPHLRHRICEERRFVRPVPERSKGIQHLRDGERAICPCRRPRPPHSVREPAGGRAGRLLRRHQDRRLLRPSLQPLLQL